MRGESNCCLLLKLLLVIFLDDSSEWPSSCRSANLLRADRTMYTCFAYLALLRLDDLTFPQFRCASAARRGAQMARGTSCAGRSDISSSRCRRLIFSNDAQKMLCFIRFAFDPELLTELCRDEWLQIYDNEYVDALIQQASRKSRAWARYFGKTERWSDPNVSLLHTLQMASHESEVQEVVDKLDQKVTLAKQKARREMCRQSLNLAATVTSGKPLHSTKEITDDPPLMQEDEDASPRQKSVAFIGTIPTPFNLTVSRPRPLPQVEELVRRRNSAFSGGKPGLPASHHVCPRRRK